MNKKELSEAYRALARRGGQATLRKHGKGHYKKMAKRRWDKVKAEKAK